MNGSIENWTFLLELRWRQGGGGKGRVFVKGSNSEHITCHYHLALTPACVSYYHHYCLKKLVFKLKISNHQKCGCLKGSFVPCVTSLGGRREKSDLSFNGQLMMSYHYTQILRSPSKPATLHPDWLLFSERGRVIFSFFPSCSWINPCAWMSSSLLFFSLM